MNDQGARGAVNRLLEAEPDFRIRDMFRLPFRDAAVWENLLSGLRAAGAPA